jgi:AcrR family transcriptional regulator
MKETADESGLADLSGRPLGERAIKKRQLLMDATEELLKHNCLRDLRVVDIARQVETSPATFYQYFRDVEDVVLQLAEQATANMPSLMKLFEGDWQGEQGLQQSRKVVDAFIRYWDKHGAVLRVRNTAADEGDERFLTIRSRASAPLVQAMTRLREKILQDANRSSQVKPVVASVAMAAVLDRLSSYHRELEALGISREDIVESCAHILHQTLTA